MIHLYHLINNDTVKYVGLTKNLTNRSRRHKKTKPEHSFKVIETYESVILACQSEVEHIKLYETIINGWNISPGGDYIGNSGYNRKGIGGVKKNTIPWNKNKSGYKVHNELYIKQLSLKNSGEGNTNSKLKECDVNDIIRTYITKPNMPDVGKVMPNGRPMSYDRSFSIEISKNYGVTPENITRIIKQKSWKKVWINYVP
jgi:hypothetical protein